MRYEIFGTPAFIVACIVIAVFLLMLCMRWFGPRCKGGEPEGVCQYSNRAAIGSQDEFGQPICTQCHVRRNGVYTKAKQGSLLGTMYSIAHNTDETETYPEAAAEIRGLPDRKPIIVS